MKYHDIFNPYTVNIFCDGSIKTNDYTGETIGAPGCCVVWLDQDNKEVILEKESYILRDCTNNMTENRSLMLAITKAIHYYRSGYKVNIFGDSQYCIFGITKWIYSWVNSMHNGHMYNSSGQIVKNEEFIKQLVLAIYNSGLQANFYHQKGHVTSTQASLDKAIDCFKKSNGINMVEPYLIERISFYNDLVDKFTKRDLMIFARSQDYDIYYQPNPNEFSPEFLIESVDMNIYKNQIKRRCRYV